MTAPPALLALLIAVVLALATTGWALARHRARRAARTQTPPPPWLRTRARRTPPRWIVVGQARVQRRSTPLVRRLRCALRWWNALPAMRALQVRVRLQRHVDAGERPRLPPVRGVAPTRCPVPLFFEDVQVAHIAAMVAAAFPTEPHVISQVLVTGNQARVELTDAALLTTDRRTALRTRVVELPSPAGGVDAYPLAITLPHTLPPAPVVPDLPQRCVPLMRRGRSTLYWPFPDAAQPHLFLAGDAVLLLAAIVRVLQRAGGVTFRCADSGHVLRTLGLLDMQHDGSALATVRLAALQRTWAAQHTDTVGVVATQDAPVVLIVVHPDEIVWRDLLPLVRTDSAPGVHVLALLDTAVQTTEARTCCHHVPVVEMVQDGMPLPIDFHPPGVDPPSPGTVLAWRPGHPPVRGTPLVSDQADLQRRFVPAAPSTLTTDALPVAGVAV